MQVLKGGIILLNLSAMSLSLNGTSQSITNKDVLEQLSELQMYINSDTTKKPIIGYKPVAVQYHSEEGGFSGTMLCSLMSEGNDITIQGYDSRITLSIVCSFSHNQEEIPLTPYVLVSADVQSSLGVYTDSNSQFGNDLTVSGDIKVDGTIFEKVGSSYTPIPTEIIYQHLIVLSGTTSRIVLKLLCNKQQPMTSKPDVISLINQIFSEQGYSSSKPMTIDCNGFFMSNNYAVSIIQLSFNGLLCTYETLDDAFGTETVVDNTSTFDALGQIDTVTDTIYRLN